MTPPILQRYLHSYAEPIVRELETVRETLQATYAQVLVIPIHDEPLDCLTRVLPANVPHSLIIGVINAAEDHDSEVIQRTRSFLAQYCVQETDASLWAIPLNATSTLLIVDGCTPGRQLPAKQGVGLARKMGGDLALACISQHIVESCWIHYTDADASLPDGYFEAVPTDPISLRTVAVLLYPFTHEPPHVNILQYEISLRYYATQLARAGSPYAFHTIGSLLTINAHHYATVRGFPKRKAAEDFYMLNKLAKVGKVVQLKSPVITLSSRLSDRVPFGTGAAMKQLAIQPDWKFYPPEIFEYLRQWLGLFDRVWCDRTVILSHGFTPWWQAQPDCQPVTLHALLSLGIEKILPQAYQQSKDLAHFKTFLHTWFDAFRTLKFVHYLRDYHFSSVPLEIAINKLLDTFLSSKEIEALETLNTINNRLILLERRNYSH
jgi:hypothetical protein